MAPVLRQISMPKPRLFLDADGVLADFDLAARQLLGMSPKEYIETHGRGAFWARLARVSIITEVPQPQAERFWHSDPAIQKTTLDSMIGAGAKVIVTLRPPVDRAGGHCCGRLQRPAPRRRDHLHPSRARACAREGR